jgi:lipoyl(octanoyl) transferase
MKIEDWGLIEYKSAVDRQLAAVDEIAAGGEQRLVLCTHPPVVTIGRGTEPGDVDGWSGDTLETSRGGRATYHGPSQIVIYPLIDLRTARPGMPARDVHAYLRALEQATVQCLQATDLQTEVRTSQLGELSLTGVWCGSKKIASIGIAVRKWITYHGVAINVLHDPEAFRGIRPCGFQSSIMTSVEEELHHPLDYQEIKSTFGRIYSQYLTGLAEI